MADKKNYAYIFTQDEREYILGRKPSEKATEVFKRKPYSTKSVNSKKYIPSK